MVESEKHWSEQKNLDSKRAHTLWLYLYKVQGQASKVSRVMEIRTVIAYVGGSACSGRWGASQGDENVLNLDICQNNLTVQSRSVHFVACKLYLKVLKRGNVDSLIWLTQREPVFVFSVFIIHFPLKLCPVTNHCTASTPNKKISIFWELKIRPEDLAIFLGSFHSSHYIPLRTSVAQRGQLF